MATLLDFRAIRDVLTSHALASGQFDSVNGHPPDTLPGTGVHVFYEFKGKRRARTSGLASTSVVLTFEASLHANVNAEPADDIDPRILDAEDALWAAYTAGFSLAGTARCIDVTGMEGQAMASEGRYARFGDGLETRAVVMTIPIVVNDVYPQAP